MPVSLVEPLWPSWCGEHVEGATRPASDCHDHQRAGTEHRLCTRSPALQHHPSFSASDLCTRDTDPGLRCLPNVPDHELHRDGTGSLPTPLGSPDGCHSIERCPSPLGLAETRCYGRLASPSGRATGVHRYRPRSRDQVKRWRVKGLIAIGGVAAAYALLGRPWHLRWGATAIEQGWELPGDELIADADLTATRAIAIRCSADQVWPWIAQVGQGRGGLYSYDVLENLVGCDMHSADHIVPEWQNVEVGDEVRLAPEVGLTVAELQKGRALVLSGGIPLGNSGAPYDFTWSFVLRDAPEGSTRLIVRERYAYKRPWARLLVEPTEAVSFLMSQKMLRGIRDRAESGAITGGDTVGDEHRGGATSLPVRRRSRS